MRVQFWLKVNIENAMTRLGPTCTGCCVRNIAYNEVKSGTCTHTYTHTHTHTHTPQSVQGYNEYKILWYFNIQSHRVQVTRHLFVSTSKRECQIIPLQFLGNKIDKYQVLIIELQKVWNVKVVVIAVVIGALGENR